MRKKFRSDISNIVDFFLLSNFWWSFSFFQWNQKQRNDHQKLDNRKKSKIFEMSLQIFLCKLLITKNSSTSNLESKVAFSLAPWWKICTVILTSIFFKNGVHFIFMENTFWSISLVLLDLQTCTVPHFKGNFIIKNFVTCYKTLQPKIELVHVKMPVYFFIYHPLASGTQCVHSLKLIDFCLKILLRSS